MSDQPRLHIVLGHYGAGKTNFAVNLALRLKKDGKKVRLADLDIVNPYFRAADSKELLEKEGIDVILPRFANTNLDIPAIPVEINRIFSDSEAYAVLDIGGDDSGAVVLGQFADKLSAEKCAVYYMINQRQPQISDPKDAAELLRDIETVSRVKANILVNNTNLSYETQPDTIIKSSGYAAETSRLTGIKKVITTVKRDVYEAMLKSGMNTEGFVPVDIFTKAFW